jgi:hypothetical protein
MEKNYIIVGHPEDGDFDGVGVYGPYTLEEAKSAIRGIRQRLGGSYPQPMRTEEEDSYFRNEGICDSCWVIEKMVSPDRLEKDIKNELGLTL